MTKEQLDQLAKGLRFCAGSKEPCHSCPYFGELDPFDCQSQVMYKAAEIIEEMAKEAAAS